MWRRFPVMVVLFSMACAPNEPPRWAEGGAPLVIAKAQWTRSGEDAITIDEDGKIYEDGDFVMLIDRAGRVVDDDYEPIAILLENGLLLGPARQHLGHVGWTNGAPPGSEYAWFSILPDGNVVVFEPDGERQNAGSWYGCSGPQQRTCTLVTQLMVLKDYQAPARSGVGIGIGIGMGIGY